MAINNIDPSSASQAINGPQKSGRINPAPSARREFKPDVVDVSAGAKRSDDIAFTKAMEIIAKTPDVREDKVRALQQNPESYTKPSSEILQAVAEKLVKDFLG